MKLSSNPEIYNILSERNLSTTYEELEKLSEDIFFTASTDSESGEIHHQITRPIVASICNFKRNGHMTNIIYTDEQPTTIELIDPDLIYRYNDYSQLCYVVAGKIVIQLKDTEIIVEEGGILLMDDQTYYREDIARSEGTVINISVVPSIISDILMELNNEDSLQGFLLRCFIKEKEKQNMLYYRPLNERNNATLNTLLTNLLFELKTKDRGYIYLCKGYLFRLFDYIASEYQYSYTKKEQDSFRKYLFNDVKLYLFRHYKDVQIQDLVDNFHYHRNFFSRLIKEFTGLTYSKFLIEVRMYQAKHLLETTDWCVEEIMLQVGYNNKGFFYQNFKELLGMSPAQYRKTKGTPRS